MLRKRARLHIEYGRRRVPAQPGGTVCPRPPSSPPPPGGGGHWRTVCDTSCVTITGGNGGSLGMGGPVNGGGGYLCGTPVCRSEWVSG